MFSSQNIQIDDYLFIDDCTSDNTNNYGTGLQYEGSSLITMSITYNSSDNCYRVMNSGRYMSLLPISSLNGTDNVEISAEINAKNTQDFTLAVIYSDDGINSNGITVGSGYISTVNNNGNSYNHRYINGRYVGFGNGSLNSDNWFKVVLTKQGKDITYKFYTINGTLLLTKTWDLTSVGADYSISTDKNIYGIAHYPSDASYGYGLIRNIQARAL